MLTTEERVRALLNNIRKWPYDLYPKFPIDKEDALALREFLKNDSRVKGCYFDEKE